MYTDLQGLDLMDDQRQLEGQDDPPTDQQTPGQTKVEPISARALYQLKNRLQSSRLDSSGIRPFFNYESVKDSLQLAVWLVRWLACWLMGLLVGWCLTTVVHQNIMLP